MDEREARLARIRGYVEADGDVEMSDEVLDRVAVVLRSVPENLPIVRTGALNIS